MFTEKQAAELNELFNKQELSKEEQKHKKYLLDLWREEDDEQARKSWIANQPV